MRSGESCWSCWTDGGLVVYEHPVPAASGDASANDQFPTAVDSPLFEKPGAKIAGRQLHDRFDAGFGGARSDHLARRASPKDQVDGAHQDGLAGPRLPRHDIEAGVKTYFEIADYGVIMDGETCQQYSLVLSRRAFSLPVGFYQQMRKSENAKVGRGWKACDARPEQSRTGLRPVFLKARVWVKIS